MIQVKSAPRTTTGSLVLVNAQNAIQAKTINENELVTLTSNGVLLHPTAATQLQKCLRASKTENAILPVSGYRSNAEQIRLYASCLAENGPQFTRQFVALPSCSEHETGLAIDLAANQKEIDPICPHLPYTGVYAGFRSMAPQFGFIERYTKEKTDITGIGAEPWHFRYVGWPHSALITQNNFALEEYIQHLHQHTNMQNPLRFDINGIKGCVYCIKPNKWENWQDEKDDTNYSVSGDNQGYLVVATWDK